MFDEMIAIGLGVYLCSLAVSILILGTKGNFNFKRQSPGKLALPIYFLMVVALYVLPLSLRSMFTLNVEGDISPQINLFVDYIPISLIMCGCFNISFAIFYNTKSPKLHLHYGAASRGLSMLEFHFFFLLLMISLWMLSQLGRQVGGIINLVLVGYNVTALFVDAGHYAVAFDWLITLAIVLLFSALISRSRHQLYSAITMITILSAVFFIMGRRSSIVVLLGASLYAYHVAYKPVSFMKFLLIVLALFFLMNFIGLVRGESYSDLGSIIGTVSKQNERLANDSPGMFYVLTTGNFAVPFETMPQVVRSIGEKYMPGLGMYSLRSLTLIVPHGIWPDRPLALSNWYMEAFYGATSKNEGKQFFFLSEAFMNFGPFGMIIWGALTAWILKFFAHLATYSHRDALIGTLVAIFIASLLNFVASDLAGFFVVFLKGFGFPVIVLLLARQFARRRRVSFS